MKTEDVIFWYGVDMEQLWDKTFHTEDAFQITSFTILFSNMMIKSIISEKKQFFSAV